MRIMLFFCVAALACAQDRAAVERYAAAHQPQIMAEFIQLLSIPNVGTDRPNTRRNAEFIRAMLQRHGMNAELLETAGNPLVYAEKNQPGAAKTILFYIHYDGQPVDPPAGSRPAPSSPSCAMAAWKKTQSWFPTSPPAPHSPTIGASTPAPHLTIRPPSWRSAPLSTRYRAAPPPTSMW